MNKHGPHSLGIYNPMGKRDNKQIITFNFRNVFIEECITGHESMRNILNSTWGLKEAGIFLDTACLPLSS